MIQNRSRVARLLARTVARGQYQFAPGRVREIRVAAKVRAIVLLRLTDLIVHGVVAAFMQEAMSPLSSPRLYSYRKGVSWLKAVADFAAYSRSHRDSRPDPRERGLYVLRRDVDAYTDSIPVGQRSPLWQMLRDVLQSRATASPVSAADWRLIERVVRPEVRMPRGGVASSFRGVPTGQPISCVLFNLYLRSLDHALARVPGGFYARYSDDILFAHPDASVAKDADALIDRVLSGLGLRVEPAKRSDYYLTGAGRASAAWPGARGTTSIPFLGAAVAADGTVGLHRQKLRRLLREIEARAIRTARGLAAEDRDRAGRIVCTVINRALDPEAALFPLPGAALLRRAVTDRRQLAQLDYRIARVVVRAVTGDTGVRGFRTTAYRTIRNEWGLISALHARNKWPAPVGHA